MSAAASDDDEINTSLLSDGVLKDEELEGSQSLWKQCSICNNKFTDPLILNCLHIFDRSCLFAQQKCEGLTEFIKCPKCDKVSGGVKTLPSYDLSLVDQSEPIDGHLDMLKCSVCTEGKEAQYRCIQCDGTLCARCRETHKVMKFFSSHEVLDLTEDDKKSLSRANTGAPNGSSSECAYHPRDTYSLFCMSCRIPICHTCFEINHSGHVTVALSSMSKHVNSIVAEAMKGCLQNREVLRGVSDTLQSVLSDLTVSQDANKSQIEELVDVWMNAIASVKEEFLQKNREIHSDIEMRLMSQIEQIRKVMDHIEFVNEFCSSYLPKCTDLQIGKLVKDVMGCLEYLRSVEFHSDMPSRIVFSKAQENVRNFIRTNFGTFDLPCSQDNALVLSFPHDRSLSFSAYPISDVANALSNLNVHRSMSHNDTFVTQNLSLPLNNDNAIDSIRSSVNGSLSIIPSRHEQIDIATTSISPWGDPGTFGTVSAAYKPATASLNGLHVNHGGLNANGPGIRSSLQLGPHSGMDLDSPSILSRPSLPSNYNLSLYEYSRLRSARCNNMALLVKFGTMGNELGRFNSPHGFCLGFDEEIVVADTYNHRIQIFSKSGEYLSYFGVSGKVDGLLWFPRKVAIIRQSQRYVVCDRGNERSRMQLFSRSGHFVRRIQIKFIDIVAGLAINQQGQIVAVDSVTPGVFVVSEEGDLIHWLDCSAFMREPSDIAIRGREYFICDFKAHCVVVIQEDGQYLRTIGGESITDFPNGIDVSGQGDVLVGDSHGNRFHIAVFTGKGELISEFVCMQTKVSRSCCLKITNEGYIVTLARSSNNVLVMSTLYVN
ncbi:unnamed protein product [Taenia asiatica]|uniref:B box-type domain-containing protein n=1 Tax=Taenia asiatica TaxID=60517 RepID=A0A0R3W9H6_TAEAS|nr:unnamed protein product [Taenia asiatica]